VSKLLYLLTVCWLFLPTVSSAHDPSSWGGMFRSRDQGLTWLPVDAGLFIGGAVGLAIAPNDPNHLLYGTDTRLLSSRNGGRDWTPEAAAFFVGPTLAVTFAADGTVALAATAAGVFRRAQAQDWAAVSVPQAAIPARAIIAGKDAARFYLLGAQGIYISRDGGMTFSRATESVPDVPGTSLVVAGRAGDAVLAALGGRLYESADGGTTWEARDAGLPGGRLEALAVDGWQPDRVWAGGDDRLFVSDDIGRTWREFGARLPDSGTSIRGVAVDRAREKIVLATHRGLLRSVDGGQSWNIVEGTLPVHLEAGPLVRDPQEPDTLYVGFSLSPYPEIFRRAQEGTNLLTRTDPVSLAGGAAFLVLLIAGGVWLVRILMRARAAATEHLRR